jgi:hypothetical protein
MAYYRRSKNWSPSPYSVGAVLDRSYKKEPADPAEIARIDAVINDPAFSSLATNKQDFIKSIKGQAASKKLSDAQIKYLASIEKDLIPADNSWWNAADPENINKRKFVVAYYGATGYYTTIINKMVVDGAFMPERGIWDKMWSNKFINARYKRFVDGNKHNVGDIVIGKYSYGAPYNGIVQNVSYNYHDGRWHYEVLCFDTASARFFKDSEVKAVKQPKAEKAPRKPRSKKVV